MDKNYIIDNSDDLDFDYQSSIIGSSNAEIIDGEYTCLVKVQKGDTFTGMKFLSTENIQKTLVKTLSDKNIEITIIYDKKYIKSIGYTKMANIYVHEKCKCCVSDRKVPLEDIESKYKKNIESGDRCRWNNHSIEINNIYNLSIGVTPTIMTFFKCA